MKSPFSEWNEEIRKYCEDNGLDFIKVQGAIKSWGKDCLTILHMDGEDDGRGLLNETPLPILLVIQKTDNGLAFQQTENTQKYLGVGGL